MEFAIDAEISFVFSFLAASTLLVGLLSCLISLNIVQFQLSLSFSTRIFLCEKNVDRKAENVLCKSESKLLSLNAKLCGIVPS